MENIKFRKAAPDDMDNVYRLSNDPEVRKVSINKSEIIWSDHVKWYTEKMNDRKVLFLIAYNDQYPFLGQARFDVDETKKSAMISLSIIKEFRCRGYGYVILKAACDQMWGKSSIKNIKAYIQPENAPSVKLFTKLGFKLTGEEIIKNYKYNIYILNKIDSLKAVSSP